MALPAYADQMQNHLELQHRLLAEILPDDWTHA